ncbi:MAG: family 43 glycosylhydrolase [Verrucomicrobiota bacterium]
MKIRILPFPSPDHRATWIFKIAPGCATKSARLPLLTCLAGVCVALAAPLGLAAPKPATPEVVPADAVLAAGTWKTAEQPVYRDPDDDWAKDPSVVKFGDTYYMYYTSANPWQDTGCGGKGEPRIDYATSPDGLTWTYQGLSIPKGKPGEWDEERPQAPAKPILKDGVYYMYYAGKNPKRAVEIGYATSTDLRHWTKNPGNPVLHKGKCNDPFIFFENGTYYLFYTSGGDSIFYVTSTNLLDWSADPVATGAVGEGSVLLKDGPTYTLFGCVGFSGNGEYYKAYTTKDLKMPFTDCGRIHINNPDFAKGTLSHGDIIREGSDYWFYMQGTRDGGKRFQIGLAKQPVPAIP